MAGRHTVDSGLTRRALANRRVRGVVAGFAGVTLGEWVLGTTLAVHAYDAGGALAVGLIGFRFAPAALAGVWTTQLANHSRRRRVLSVTALCRAFAAALAAAALIAGLPFGFVIALVWLDAAAGSGYRPVQAALLPGLVQTPGELTASTALVSNVKTSGQMIGALVGGVLVATVTPAIPVLCASCLYLAAAALTAGDRTSHPFSSRLVGLGGVRTGLHKLRTVREARRIVVYSSLRSLVRGLWLSLTVVASLRLFSLGRSGFGILMAAAAVGTLGAIFVTSRLVGNQRLASWFAFGLSLCGLPIAATGLSSSAAPAIVLMVVWGIGMSLSDVAAQALLNRIVGAESIGPVTGVMEGGKLLFEGCGSLIAPALLLAFGIRSAVLVAGAVLPILVVLGYQGFGVLDDRARARIEVLELLRGVPFFAPLHVDALEGIAAHLQPERHTAGEVIVREGDGAADRWYLVGDGELVVEVDGYLVGELRRGGQFGERALLRGVPRAATVRAVSDVLLYGLDRRDFFTAMGVLALADPDAGDRSHSGRIDPSAAVIRAPLLHSLQPAAIDALMRRTTVREFAPGERIITQGADEDSYHVLLSGCVRVCVDGTMRAELLPGDSFGEIAVLHRIPRTADVIARDASSVLTIDGEAVRTAVRDRGGPLAALAG